MPKDVLESAALTALISRINDKSHSRPLKANDCKKLSAEILSQTGFAVSETTLKRLFGFAVSNYKLSGFTKNALSNFLGYADWATFVISVSDSTHQYIAGTYWNELRKKAWNISNYTYTALTNRSGIPFRYTVHRSFAEDHIRSFLQSKHLATSFIAPSGYGKTTLLNRLVEKFWLSDTSEFKNDIVWFISGQTIGGLLNKGFDLNDWFMNQMGLIGNETIREYFLDHPEEVGGRMIMILDGFDDLMHREDELQTYFSRVLDFITVNQEFNWIKIIISARTQTWAYVSEQIDDSSFIKDHWFLGDTFNGSTQINVPFFTRSELNQVLVNISGQDFKITDLNEQLAKQLSNPYYIQLLFQLKMIGPEKKIFQDKFNYFDLVSEFILLKIYQNRFSSDKVAIIKRFLDATSKGNHQGFVEKSLLIPEKGDLKKGYDELISSGILVEENLSSNLGFKQVIYVNHFNLLEYFIARELLTIHQQYISSEIFSRADFQYSNSRYKIPLLRWLIYFAVKSNQLLGLTAVLKLRIGDQEKENLIIFIADLTRKKYLDNLSKGGKDHYLLLEKPSFSWLLNTSFRSRAYIATLEVFYTLSINKTEKICIATHIAYYALIDINLPLIYEQIKTLDFLGSSAPTAFKIDPVLLVKLIYNCYTGRLQNNKASDLARSFVKINELAELNPYQQICQVLINLAIEVVEKHPVQGFYLE